MRNRRELIRELKKEIDDLSIMARDYKQYNDLVRKRYQLYKMLLYLDKLAPYVLSASICIGAGAQMKLIPFGSKTEKVYSNLEVLHSSTGMVETKESFDKKYDSKVFEYHSSWYVNEFGLYEQTITYYRYSETKDYDISSLLNMSNEELNNLFSVIDIKTTSKSRITDEELAEVPHLTISFPQNSDNFHVEPIPFWKYLLAVIFYILASGLSGFAIRESEKIFLKDRIRAHLSEKIKSNTPISEHDISEIEDILKIKIDNFNLLTDNEITSRGR